MSAHTEDPRTGLVELSAEECWEHLNHERFGRVAVVDGHAADIFPVNYRVHAGDIVIRTEGGTKLAAATLGGPVAFEIDEVDAAGHQGWSVVVKGHAHEPHTVEDVLDLEDLDLAPWVDAPKSRWLVITPQAVTGRAIEHPAG